jgi:hypothetical protein
MRAAARSAVGDHVAQQRERRVLMHAMSQRHRGPAVSVCRIGPDTDGGTGRCDGAGRRFAGAEMGWAGPGRLLLGISGAVDPTPGRPRLTGALGGARSRLISASSWSTLTAGPG